MFSSKVLRAKGDLFFATREKRKRLLGQVAGVVGFKRNEMRRMIGADFRDVRFTFYYN